MSADFLPVAAAGVIITLLSVTLRDLKREYAVMLSAVGAVLLAVWGTGELLPIAKKITELAQMSRIKTEYAEIMLKALGISICAKIGGDICRDSGESAIGGKVEFCGRVCLLVLALPIFEELLTLAGELLSA